MIKTLTDCEENSFDVMSKMSFYFVVEISMQVRMLGIIGNMLIQS